MSKPVKKKQCTPLYLVKLYECERAISRWLCHRHYVGYKPSYVVDYLVWLHKFHPELRERVDDAIDDLTECYNNGAFDGFEPWQM